MRLIDVDKLKPSLIAELVCGDGEDEEDIIAYKIETIETAPTVEAIPIEWIWNKWLRRKKQRWVDTDTFIDLINDWRKENEID